MKRYYTLSLSIILIGFLISCVSEQEPLPSLCDNGLTISLESVTPSLCNQSNGSITVSGSGGVPITNLSAQPGYLYSLDGGTKKLSGTFDGLSAGTYTIEIFDAEECNTSLQATINNSDGLSVSLTTVGTACGENQGSILITASDAVGLVEYKLNDGNYQSSNSFQNLAQGGYTISTRDDSGCEIIQEVDIKTDARFSDVELIIQADCAVSGCHNGSQAPDLRGANNIIANADRIKVRTSNRTMPIGGRSLTDDEIALIACWVDDGASGN